MDALKIKGGKALKGSVRVGGAKNAALPIIAATLLAEGENTITNMPALADVDTMAKLLAMMGAEVDKREKGVLRIATDKLKDFEAPYDLVRTMRASVLVLGPLLARYGQCRVSLPGGCAIGARPIDQHLKGLTALGADITLVHGYVEAKASRLKGTTFIFDVNTVTGTENVLMAAVLARGETVLRNAALEPEVVDLANALRSMGAEIEGDGTTDIRVVGREGLSPMKHAVMPDRIEAGTFAAAAAMSGGDVLVEGGVLSHLGAVADKLRDAGAKLTQEAGGYRVIGPKRLKAIDFTTAPYPGFATDMQAQLMAAMAVAEGSSVVRETVFENRYMHVPEMTRLGADITIDGNVAVVRGVEKLMGATVMATDLRASASLVLSGLVAEGETVVRRIYHLDRGYAALEKKLAGLGAEITRFSE
ncbi:MAG: UDP-N-acetylglucosamine 1-carboxyvinyltransferase [Deltaproteobacteria bacterium]|nr:UDP-N-acetylglucosamine 1-carboxyvinyltransferase [Deltaproteobacteria bacterium]